MSTLNIIFGLLAGLALFLYGLRILSKGLQKIAGERLKLMLGKLTTNPVKGAAVGTFTTALIQSSSVTVVTLIGLVNAGLLSLKQAIGVILGTEIGTTLTAQLIAFRVGLYFLPIIVIGFGLFFFSKNLKYKFIGQTIFGFGLLFLGMSFMADSVAPLSESPAFINFLINFGTVPILGVLAGAIFTGIVQSSSATTGLVIAMGMQGIVTLPAAIAIIFGANIGTCITGMLASIESSLSGKRAAVAQLIINIIGVSIFFLFITPYAYIISLTSADLPRQIANAHTIFNVIITAVMLPLIGFIVFLVKKIVPGEEIRVERGTKFLDKRILNVPTLALEQVNKEVNRMGKLVSEMISISENAVLNNNAKLAKLVFEKENVIDEIHHKIDRYLTQIPRRTDERAKQKHAKLLHSVTDIERVADHTNNVAESAVKKIDKKLVFSDQAKDDLKIFFEQVKETFDKAVECLKNDDKILAREVQHLEKGIDKNERRLLEAHTERLKKGICHPESDLVFIDILSNLERIGDHSDNMANSVLMGF